MEAAQSDALVFFGASGDLAFKQIFPALLGLVSDEGVNVPIVGVAKAGWTVEQLQARAKDSIEQHGHADAAGLAKLLGLLRYVDGDYNDPQTFAQLKQALGAAKRPLHYLAIPPGLFGVVVSALAQERSQRQRAPRRREAVRPRSRVGAGAQPHSARAFPRRCDLSHRPLSGQGAGPEHSLHAVRQCDVRAALEPPLCPQHPDHHGGILRRSGPRKLLRRRRRASRRGSEPHAAGACERDDGRADRRRA